MAYPRRDEQSGVGKTMQSCMVKVYGDRILKMNTIVEVVGVYTGPANDGHKGESWPEVPKVHVIAWRNLGEANPMMMGGWGTEKISTLKKEVLKAQICMGRALIAWISKAFSGDDLAAEYLLYNMISRVAFRHEETVVGSLPLNITYANSSDLNVVCRVVEVVRALLPKSLLISLTRQELSSGRLISRRDIDQNRLHAGMLQLSTGTHLVIDEVALEEGPLGKDEQDQLENLKKVLFFQKTEYDLEVYKKDFEMNIMPVVVSEARSLFKPLCVVPLHIECSWGERLPAIPESTLNSWRALIARWRESDLPLPSPEAMKRMQDDFVRIRASQGPQALSEGTYGMWITLAQLSGITLGKRTLDVETWEIILALENRRRSRCQRVSE
ncbi:mini-chromosome maintenance complex-binding protein-like [Schistocerca gregaria]|uniref:mini-chromosome maintenance complex-binding protein-like n=1 Tax=Schistocerca gregaria TaxID=7010 RepID=UPI00211E4DC4|nr:mini-chromosome maintenance complex-binding protein-like [Schistocerca gregaria]